MWTFLQKSPNPSIPANPFIVSASTGTECFALRCFAPIMFRAEMVCTAMFHIEYILINIYVLFFPKSKVADFIQKVVRIFRAHIFNVVGYWFLVSSFSASESFVKYITCMYNMYSRLRADLILRSLVYFKNLVSFSLVFFPEVGQFLVQKSLHFLWILFLFLFIVLGIIHSISS